MNTSQNSQLTALESLSLGAISALQALTATHSAQIGELFALTDRDRRDARRGTSTALALTTAPMPSNVGGVSYALNAATYRGEQAVGLSFAYRANTENSFAVTGGVSYAGGDNVGARIGVAGEFIAKGKPSGRLWLVSLASRGGAGRNGVFLPFSVQQILRHEIALT